MFIALAALARSERAEDDIVEVNLPHFRSKMGEGWEGAITRRLRSDSDERGMLMYGYKFRPVIKANGRMKRLDRILRICNI